MKKIKPLIISIMLIFSIVLPYHAVSQTPVPKPEQHFGFVPGTDRMLFNYEEMISYFVKLDEASAMVKLVEIGLSPMGKKMYIVFISAEKNIKNLDRLREINRELALNPELPDTKRTEYIKEGKVFFLATLSMHSTEVAPAQAAPLIAYKLITSGDPMIARYLDDVVYMMIPNHNPDGMDLVVENYKKYKGTKYEGASLPRVYHKYVGHDNNRDFIGLTQSDTRAVARVYNLDWFPQVMVEKHQMGSTGIRYFVPPPHDPIAENIDAELWTWMGTFGTNMLRDLTNEGLAGVGQKTIFDDYWPGSTETCLWKNVIGMLTEAASAKEATPIYIEPGELQASGKGLSEYEKTINFPLPWTGGWWRLNDIVKLEISSTFSIIKTASLFKNDILRFRNDLCKREVERGSSQPPYYYVVPKEQADQYELVSLIELMKEQGINTFQLKKDYTLNGINLREGDIVYPLAQPFRAFIKEVMERQEFPVRHYTPGGELINPYDITSWSLPLHRGLVSYEIKTRDLAFEVMLKPLSGDFFRVADTYKFPAVFPVSSNGSFKAAFMAMQNDMKVSRTSQEVKINGKKYGKGSFVIRGSNETLLKSIVKETFTEPGNFGTQGNLETTEITLPRIALVETYFHDMDAGWTRYLFDFYKLPFTVIHPDEFEKTDFIKDFDIVIIPSSSKSLLMNGKTGTEGNYNMSNYHPDYQKGMGKKGLEKLLLFIDQGGKVLSWGQSTDLFTGMLETTAGETKQEFTLPFSNVAAQAQKEGLNIPGSLVRMELKPDQPLTYGMPSETGVFYRGEPLFITAIPRFDMDRRVIGTFPGKDILLSGYADKEEKIAEKPAFIWIKKGKGQLILYCFNPQFRASSQATFKLLFNALFLPPVE